MTGTETADLIEWRASPGWALRWIALLGLIALPFLGFGAWLAAREIGNAPDGTWPAYLIFLGLFAAIVLGGLAFGVIRAIVACASLVFSANPVLQATRHGVEIRAPLSPPRSVRWSEIKAVEIERTRQQGRKVFLMNHVIFRLKDPAAREFSIKPQMAGLTLEHGHAQLSAMHARFAQPA